MKVPNEKFELISLFSPSNIASKLQCQRIIGEFVKGTCWVNKYQSLGITQYTNNSWLINIMVLLLEKKVETMGSSTSKTNSNQNSEGHSGTM